MSSPADSPDTPPSTETPAARTEDSFTENRQPEADPLGHLVPEEPHLPEFQRYTILGIGILFVLSLVSITVIAVSRPELADLAGTLGQLLFGGLIGLGGSIIGYLFADRRKGK